MKSKWYYRLPVKALAIFLLLVLLSAGFLGLYGVVQCGDAGFYDSSAPSFAGSGLAWNIARNYHHNVENIVYSLSEDGEQSLDRQDFLSRMRKQFSADKSNLVVVLESDSASAPLRLETLLGLPEHSNGSWQRIGGMGFDVTPRGGVIGEWLDRQKNPRGIASGSEYAYDAEEAMEEYPDDYVCITANYYLDADLPVYDEFSKAEREFREMGGYAYPALVLLAVSALLSLIVWIFLMCAAGHRVDTDNEVITLRFLDRIPYDLFGGVSAAGLALCGLGLGESFASLQRMQLPLFVLIAIGCALGAEILFIAFTLSTAARWKSRTLLRNTIIWRFCAWLWRGILGTAGRVGERMQPKEVSPEEQAKKQEQRAQTMQKLGKGARTTAGTLGGLLASLKRVLGSWWQSFRGTLDKGLELLPLVWKGVLLLIGVGIVNFFLLILAINGDEVVCLSLLLIFDLFILWKYIDILGQMRWLHYGAKKIAEGELDYRIPTEIMKWEFKSHGEALNTIRSGIDAAVEERVKAVKDRVKSDRMRNELLTNVSHDIKTPLTSIINYVDLLKKEDVQGEKAKEYIEVLDRQSIRLKKLLEDLLEASKASTGNITVNAAPTNVGELLRQVAGEYAEKLSAANLEPIITLPGKDALIFADGRLLWRVFDNLMANIVKYAMPQTRVYLDLRSDASMTAVAVKNVSKDRLNIAPDELIERFVRGDASRATEGSGLGLSIAQSLTELMGGEFSLMIDGDLFKVEIRFPTLNEPTPQPDNAGQSPVAEPTEAAEPEDALTVPELPAPSAEAQAEPLVETQTEEPSPENNTIPAETPDQDIS